MPDATHGPTVARRTSDVASTGSPELRRRLVQRQPPGSRGEHVAAMERGCRAGRHRQRVGREQAAAALGCGHQQPIVGPDEEAPVAGGEHERPPVGADAGIHDGQMDPHGYVRERIGERARALRDIARRHAVREMHDARLPAPRAGTAPSTTPAYVSRVPKSERSVTIVTTGLYASDVARHGA